MQQTVFQPQPNLSQQDSKRAQSPSIIFIALTLFALAGLMIGFAVGLFTYRKTGQTPKNNNGSSITVVHPKTSPTVAVVPPQELDCPKILTLSSGTQLADGTTSYSIIEQAMALNAQGDTICKGNSHPIQVNGITFKLWLTKGFQKTLHLPGTPSQLLTNISNPITGTIEDQNYPDLQSLNFDPTTKQVQPSNNQGQATWKYTVSSSTQPGNYDLVILADWSGKYFNWSWIEIVVQGPGNH